MLKISELPTVKGMTSGNGKFLMFCAIRRHKVNFSFAEPSSFGSVSQTSLYLIQYNF